MLNLFATAASPVTLPSTWLLGLLAIIVWFLKRVITDNDKAHQELGTRINRVDSKVDRVDDKVDQLASYLAALRESIGRIEGHLLNRPTSKA